MHVKTPKSPPAPPKPRRVHGEDWLDRLDTITLRLENGDRVEFRIAEEVSIPPDASLHDLRRLDAASPGRLAFWSAQVARQRRALAKARRAALKVEAESDLVARRYVVNDTDFTPTERVFRSYTDTQPELKQARLKVDEAQYVLDLLEAVREAVRTRSFVLGRLLTIEANAREG